MREGFCEGVLSGMEGRGLEGEALWPWAFWTDSQQ